MTFEEALTEIRSFWSGPLPFGGAGLGVRARWERRGVRARLEREFGRTFPRELADYVSRYAPTDDFAFRTAGNEISLKGAHRLSSRVDGYTWDTRKEEPVEDWPSSWVMIGDEGADPFIVDLAFAADPAGTCPVLRAPHGAGVWEADEVAPSIPVFLVMVAAQHHAMTAFVSYSDLIIDDERGFNLNQRSAEWYFPFVRREAPSLYDTWLEDFDNR